MNDSRLQNTINAIDEVNQLDPISINVNNTDIARELIYGQRMSQCLNEFWQDANELLQIAVRAQHIKRWHLLRKEFDAGRTGYLLWRKQLGVFHADLTSKIMLDNGYTNEDTEQVTIMLTKKGIKTNSDTQTLEDVACLVFLQHYFDDFANKHDNDKLVDIVQKTWRKMSDKGHDIALQVEFPSHLAAIITQALK